MNVMTTNTTTVESVAFASLSLSDLNPRTVVNDDSIVALAANISSVGLIQNLAGYHPDNGDVEIVAGGRRLRALALLQDDPRFQTVSVKVTDDEAVARLWATSENSQREALNPADEIRDFGAMAKRGVAVPEIAVAYGVTEKHVYRRLALANLPCVILDGLKDGKVSLSAAAAFTIGSDERLVLEVFQEYMDRAEQSYGHMSEAQIKRALKPDTVTDTDRRAIFVTVETYKAAGGRTSSDLFANTILFEDVDILDSLFAEKLEFEANRMKSTLGVKWAEAFDGTYLPYDFIADHKFGRVYPEAGDLTEAEQERYDALGELAYDAYLSEAEEAEHDALEVILKGDFTDAQKAHYGIVVLVDRDGQIEITEGLVRKEDQAAAIEAGILAATRHEGSSTPAPKSPISAKLQGDLDRIVTGSRQNALLDDPSLALHLLAFQLTNRMGYHRAFGISTTDVPNAPSTETGFDLDKRLVPTESGYSYESDLAGDFAKFRKRGDKKIMDLLQNALVAKLSIGNADLGAALDKLTTRETRAHFTPTAENFFGRVSGPYLCGLWNDLLDLAADHPTATNFAKKKKGEKAEALDSLFNDPAYRDAHSVTAEQLARITAWLPEGMH